MSRVRIKWMCFWESHKANFRKIVLTPWQDWGGGGDKLRCSGVLIAMRTHTHGLSDKGGKCELTTN